MTAASPPDEPAAALVTGAGRRIGAAIARALARTGRPIALHANRSAAAAELVAREIVDGGGRACVVRGELADPAAPDRLVAEARAALGPLGVLVNSASSFETDAVGALDVTLWDRQMAVNLRAPVFLIEAFAAQLDDGATGCAVNILDQRVLKPTPAHVSYTLAKSALATATVTLAQALAPRVRVVGVGPGPTLKNPRQSREEFARQCAAMPLGRGPSPDEIAEAVIYLVGAGSVTGAILPVDGGQHVSWRTPGAED
ncbi:SDR family oxidoreductase [Methylopila sp. M107]|uniref:SDR family oxidoreductase n=1 Tax=Methylopila sp. M107 TaxID=1101190 RepID=UPI0003702F35|nr:SDR family oxidoreductase [Methylopila sp. M107]